MCHGLDYKVSNNAAMCRAVARGDGRTFVCRGRQAPGRRFAADDIVGYICSARHIWCGHVDGGLIGLRMAQIRALNIMHTPSAGSFTRADVLLFVAYMIEQRCSLWLCCRHVRDT